MLGLAALPSLTETKKGIITESLGERCVLCLADCPQGFNCHVFDNADTARRRLVRPEIFHLISLERYIAETQSTRYDFEIVCPTCQVALITAESGDPPLFFAPCPQICAFLLAKLKSDPTTFVGALPAHRTSASRQVARLRQPAGSATYRLPISPHSRLQTFRDGVFQPATAVTPGEQHFRIVDAKAVPIGHPTDCAGRFSLSPGHELGKHTDGSHIMWLIMGRSVGAFLTLFLVLTLGGQETRTSYSRELLELVGYLYQRYSAAIVQTEEDSGRGVARGGQRRTKHDGGCCPRFIRCPSIVDKVGSMSLPPPALNSQNAKAALGTLLEESRTDSILLMQHLRELWTLDLSDSADKPAADA